jgi:hypothetical protein
MVAYSQSSRDATSADRKKLWDPWKILRIINTDPGYGCITCVGHAPSKGRRCRIAPRGENKGFITQALADIRYLSPDSPTVRSRLRAIVGPALCARYHQGQVEAILTQWERKIQQLKSQTGEQKPVKRTQSRTQQEPPRDQTVADLQEQLRELRRLLAKTREQVNNQRYQDQGSERREEQAAKDREEEHKRRSEEKETEARREERERVEKERLEKERLEKERSEKEKADREEKIRRERIRQKANELREKRERQKREREQKEREEWDQLWTTYQEKWVNFRASATREGNIKDAIPWPVKSGSIRDVKATNVKEFFESATPRGANMAELMRKECQKWHPDRYQSWLRGVQLLDGDKIDGG